MSDGTTKPITLFGPDFPFAYDEWLTHTDGLGRIPERHHGREVAVIGAGVAGLTAAYELMKLGLRPVIHESRRIGGRLHSEPFKCSDGIVAELGGMRFPRGGTAFRHYVELLGLETRPFPNPLARHTPSTLIDLDGHPIYLESGDSLPPPLDTVDAAWHDVLEQRAGLSAIQHAIRTRDVPRLKALWHPLVKAWDERSFHDFLATSEAFRRLSFRDLEIFGQVGFGTGGWDTDFPNSMLEVLRVVFTECESDQYFIVGGAEQVPRGLWRHPAPDIAHWPPGTSLESLHMGATRPAVKRLARSADGRIALTDRWGYTHDYEAVIVTCQSWLLTTRIDTEERLFSNRLWMALDRTRYMQSSKTFVMVDRPFWRERDAATGRHRMSMTLTDRVTRGTYLFDLGEDRPGVICLSYAWANDALKMLPLPVDERVRIALEALSRIYPDVDLRRHIVGEPITVSWEDEPDFLGAFKSALPGHYRYTRRMFCHFMQDRLPPTERGIYLAGDDIGWMPGWVETAVNTALNAVWAVMHQFEGHTPERNPGPGDRFDDLAPLELEDDA